MFKEPTIIDLVLIHLKESGFIANGWKSQSEMSDDIAWITVARGPYYPLYVSDCNNMVLISDVSGAFKKLLDPNNPRMFDQLDLFLGTLHGRDS